MYKHKAPIDKDNVTTIVPVHLPKINPPINATGLPKPKRKTHKTVMKKKLRLIILNYFPSIC